MLRARNFFYKAFLLTAIILSACSYNKPVEVPTHFPNFDVLINKENAFDGLLFLKKISNPGYHFAIDNSGTCWWIQRADTTLLRVYTPLEDGYLTFIDKKRLLEVSYDGEILNRLSTKANGLSEFHHDIQMAGDHYIGITHEEFVLDLEHAGGLKNDTIKTDGLQLISREGELLWKWSFQSVIDTMTYPELYPDLSLFQLRNDWVHTNSIFVDDDKNYILSFRDLDQLWKIDSKTGDIIWKLGGELEDDPNKKFYNQHGIHKNWDGDYMLFDNGDGRIRRDSRALAFRLDANNNMIITKDITLPDSLFSNKQGSVYQIGLNRYLFSSPMTQALVVTDSLGNIHWLAKSDNGFYRAHYLEKDVLLD